MISSFLEKRYYLPLLSAILLAVSIIPYYLLVTNFIFLIPLLFFIAKVDSWKDALKGGIWFALPLYLITAYWMYTLLSVSFAAVFLYFAAVLYVSLFAVILIMLAYCIHARCRIPFFIFLPFLWIVMEDVRTYGPFRITADHIANSMAIYPSLIQFIDMTGPHGITVWLIGANALIFGALSSFNKRKRRSFLYAFAAIIMVVLPALYSIFQWKTMKYEPDLRISMVQPNISQEMKFDNKKAPEIMNTMQSITQQALKQKPDLLVWPETAFPFTVQHWIERTQRPSLPEISALAQYSATPMLIGAEYLRIKTKDDYVSYNAALLMDSRGNITDYYGKLYPVPFAEEIPFKKILGMQRLAKKGILSRFGGFDAGDKFTLFEFERKSVQQLDQSSATEIQRKVRFSVLICYEGLYPELSRKFRKLGADFLICITNDSWFGHSLFPYWHARALRMRAIENRTSIVRCANTGVSSFYDPTGRMYQSTEIFTKSVVSGMITTTSVQTCYARYGDLIVYISYPILIIFLLCSIFRRKKHQPSEPAAPSAHEVQ